MAHTPLAQASRSGAALRWVGRGAAVLAGAAGLVALLMYLAGFFHPKVSTERVAGTPIDPSKLELVEVRAVKRPRSETAVGSIRAVHEAGVASRLLARVVEMKAKAGQPVKQGEVLVRLDDADLQAKLKQSEAAHAAANATREQAHLEHERAKKLLPAKAIAQSEYDRIATTLRTADADVTRADQAVQEAKAMLSYATITSPMNGVVVEKKVDTGDTVTPGQVLVTLYNPGRMQMLVSVRESLALKLKVGQKVPGRLDSLGFDCEATISEIVPESQAASRSFTVKVVGPCPPGVYSGMFGRIYIPLEDEEIVVVPATAIKRVGQIEMVQLLDNNTLRRRAIQTGRRFDDDIEVLAGLKPGEKIVATNTEAKP